MSVSYQHVGGVAEPLPDDILVVDMEQGNKVSKGGIIFTDDTSFGAISDSAAKAATGVRPRWARVYKVGTNVDYLTPGEYVLVAHGRWTYAIDFTDSNSGEKVKLQKVDAKEILLVSDDVPEAIAAYNRAG